MNKQIPAPSGASQQNTKLNEAAIGTIHSNTGKLSTGTESGEGDPWEEETSVATGGGRKELPEVPGDTLVVAQVCLFTLWKFTKL